MWIGDSSIPNLLSFNEDNLCQKPSSTALWKVANWRMGWSAMPIVILSLLFSSRFNPNNPFHLFVYWEFQQIWTNLKASPNIYYFDLHKMKNNELLQDPIKQTLPISAYQRHHADKKKATKKKLMNILRNKDHKTMVQGEKTNLYNFFSNIYII